MPESEMLTFSDVLKLEIQAFQAKMKFKIKLFSGC